MKRFPLIVCIFLLLLVAAGIPLAAATPTVSGVSPSSGPLNTYVTLKVTGSGFSSASTVYLYKCGAISAGGSQRKFTGNIQRMDSNSITASFSLSGIKEGDYGVIVNTPTATGGDDMGYKENIFVVYAGSSGGSTTTTTTTDPTETATTATISPDGENSVFFETNPSGAEIWLDGEDIGTSAFTYYTNHDGVYNVVVKKIGYEDYEAKVTILNGKRVHFYAPLTIQSTSGTTTTKTTTVSKTPGKTTTTAPGATAGKTTAVSGKPTVKIPTPLGTDDPPAPTEESPVDPATTLLAAALGMGFIVVRRR
jgi:hypothetical protein